MKVLTFENEAEWKAYRVGKITGTRLKDIVSVRGKRKMAFYELIAERMGVPAEDEIPMERGKRLEPEAIQKFTEQEGYAVDTGLKIWVSDLNPDITCSPDGSIDDGVAAVEVKCLASAKHIQAIVENKIPDEYELQVLQYFICNEKLERLYFVMYDPRIVARPLVVFTIFREDLQTDIETNFSFEVDTLQQVNEWVAKLSNF